VRSRAEAKAMIEAGVVTIRGIPSLKVSTLVDEQAPIAVSGPRRRFVSRGGDKLAAALEAFPVAVEGETCLDAGASTGGFTDCLLQAGAASVTAVDVGYGQLAWSLQTDPRVRVVERTNIRYANPRTLGAPFGVIVADLSFISLCTVVPVLAACGSEQTEYVVLVKPQFEAGREDVGKGGIVRDPAVRRDAVEKVIGCFAAAGLGARGVIRSPLEGAGGNVEFLLWARWGPATIDRAALRLGEGVSYGENP
jgi:23S rRNA (cytidine1920-2'-O)/16S rRNA (cytidine1409-2'-O)-methyltransferase